MDPNVSRMSFDKFFIWNASQKFHVLFDDSFWFSFFLPSFVSIAKIVIIWFDCFHIFSNWFFHIRVSSVFNLTLSSSYSYFLFLCFVFFHFVSFIVVDFSAIRHISNDSRLLLSPVQKSKRWRKKIENKPTDPTTNWIGFDCIAIYFHELSLFSVPFDFLNCVRTYTNDMSNEFFDVAAWIACFSLPSKNTHTHTAPMYVCTNAIQKLPFFMTNNIDKLMPI